MHTVGWIVGNAMHISRQSMTTRRCVKTAKLWAELNNAPILPEHINCEGCRVDGAKTVFCDSLCGIRQCALKKMWKHVVTAQTWKAVRRLERSSQIIRTP